MSTIEEGANGRLVLVDGGEVSEQGSFNWYLDPNGGGHFVKAIAHAIQLADSANLDRLAYAFPQMVLAFSMPSWTKAPPGWDPRYNAGGAANGPYVVDVRRVIGGGVRPATPEREDAGQ